jgi:hypothetical protein
VRKRKKSIVLENFKIVAEHGEIEHTSNEAASEAKRLPPIPKSGNSGCTDVILMCTGQKNG